MSWTPVTPDQTQLFRDIMLWIETVRATDKRYGSRFMRDENWLPCESDFAKSALLERIRSGLKPLDEPPPVGFACPWYAVVEDAGPHYVWGVNRLDSDDGKVMMVVNQNAFLVYEEMADDEYIVGDKLGTSYRFRLWFDEEWVHPHAKMVGPKGGWFIQNIVFGDKAEAA